MDIDFYIPRGCYYLVQGGGTPYWSLAGFNNIKTNYGIPAWITSVTASTAENIAKIPCFNNIKVAAIIGDGFGNISISGIALLGANAKNRFEEKFQGIMEGLRASHSYSPCTVSSKGGGSYRFLLEHYGVQGWYDEERQILAFGCGGSLI